MNDGQDHIAALKAAAESLFNIRIK